ncbi:sorting nexin-19a isoform X1 [Alosa sapidissima]|uniref:sorting nexin-19a isoform X1 n=1 Tax=Alosa sapidissima TaxID=34773 RepID=UPI001C099FA1|nr:sorting nexin-19a isoform X1 [Alosa sapidissima]XP_041949057.1 sorting nexin-19a isoform X1 [Alosa sapidissima]
MPATNILAQRKVLGCGVFLAWLVLFHLLVNVWLLCVFTSLLVVLGGWLGSRVMLDGNSLLHLEHFLPLYQSPPAQPAVDSERRLDWEIHSAVSKAVRDFVSSWYRTLVAEEEGEFEWVVRDAMLASAAELKRRARHVDRRALAQRVLELCGCHLQSYSRARQQHQQQQAQARPDPGSEPHARGGGEVLDLWQLYSQAFNPHPALASGAAELSYSRSVVDLLMHALVPYPLLETRTGRFMVVELITCNVLLPLVARVSSPDWLNLTIVDVFTKPSSPGDEAETQEAFYEAQQDSWSCGLDSTMMWRTPEMSSVTLTEASSYSSVGPTSTESSAHSLSSLEEPTQCGGTGRLFSGRVGPARPPTDLLRLIRSSRWDQEADSSDLESPSSDSKKISYDSLNFEEDKTDRFCDCVSTTDFCGLVCLEEEPFGFLSSGKRSAPKVRVSGQHSWPESPVEEMPASLHQGSSVTAPGSLCLPPFKFEPLGSPEGPVVIQNLHITGTVTAKEHRGSSTHPYTLYTVKYETVTDSDGSGTDQSVAYHTVNRRYSEFLNLQTRLEEKPELRKVVKNVKGPKRLFLDLPFGNADVDKVEARKGQLETYLKQLCTIPETANSDEVQEFLGLNTDARMTFEKKPSISRIDKLVVNAIVDTLKTAFPRSEPQSPTEEAEGDCDGRNQPDGKKIRSRLRFSSKIAPSLNIPDMQPKVMYTFSEGSTVLQGLSITGLEGLIREQERVLCGPQKMSSEEGQAVGVDQRGGRERSRTLERRSRSTDTALADVALNILCLLMKDQWSWLCTENIQKTIRLLFGTFIERWLDVGIRHLTSAPCWVIYLRVLQEAVWPGGELPAEQQPERSPEQREETRQQCLDCLTQMLPDFISEMLGSEKYRLSWEHMLGSLQDPNINRHLVYCIFDLLLEFLIPESSEEAFQKSLLQSLSRDVERTATSP